MRLIEVHKYLNNTPHVRGLTRPNGGISKFLDVYATVTCRILLFFSHVQWIEKISLQTLISIYSLCLVLVLNLCAHS